MTVWIFNAQTDSTRVKVTTGEGLDIQQGPHEVKYGRTQSPVHGVRSVGTGQINHEISNDAAKGPFCCLVCRGVFVDSMHESLKDALARRSRLPTTKELDARGAQSC